MQVCLRNMQVADQSGEIARLNVALNDMTERLSHESDTSSEMKSQLQELKREYIAAGDRLESDQMTIRTLQVQPTLSPPCHTCRDAPWCLLCQASAGQRKGCFALFVSIVFQCHRFALK